MKHSEMLERIGCGELDDKARRVSNTSTRVASVTAEEIEAGVTLERLDQIGVPVYRYQTQVTIHGRLPDYDPASRPGGYKSIITNQNGSLGVRYVAIDAQKKALLVRASRAREGVKGWGGNVNSTGFSVDRFTMDKAECLQWFQELKALSGLFYGDCWAAACALGGYMTGANIGAIPVENMGGIMKALWGFSNEGEVAAIEIAKQEKWERERAADAVRYAEAAAIRKVASDAAIERVKAQLLAAGHKPCGVQLPGVFVVVMTYYSGEVAAKRYTVSKGGFGRWLYGCGDSKRKVADKAKVAQWDKLASAGLVFTGNP